MKRNFTSLITGLLTLIAVSLIAPVIALAGQNPGESFGLISLVGGAFALGNVIVKDFSINGKTMKVHGLDIDRGFYKQADARKGAVVMLEEMYAEKAGEDSPYLGLGHAEIHRKKKQLVKEGKEVPLTAFEKQLLFHGISINGQNADVVSKFFTSTGSTALFPAYVSDQILVGQLLDVSLDAMVATRTSIDSMTYDKVTMSETEEERQTKKKTEGASMRKFTIATGKRSIRLKQYAGILESSYQAVKFQKLPVFAKMLQRIGMQMSIDKMDELILALKNGDGNTGTAITSGRTYTQVTVGAIGLVDVIGWANFATAPYKIDHFVGLKAHLNEWYNALASMNNPSDQFGFIGIKLPMAHEYPRSASGMDASTNAFYGVDSRFAVEEVNNGPILIESDKLIDRQLERVAISESTAFALDENGVFRFTAI